MLKSPIHELALFFDMEWVPDAAGAKRLFDLDDDTTEIDAILRRGAEKAEALSAPVLAEVKQIVGFLKL